MPRTKGIRGRSGGKAQTQAGIKISEAKMRKMLKSTLGGTDIAGLGEKYSGKVRDCYSGGALRFLVSSDRLSAFDVILTTIPYKGQVLTSMSEFWFNQTRDLVKNHLVSVPDPNVMAARTCEMYPLEFVVRGYLAGSAWRDYQKGKPISGVELPDGMKKNQRLDEPIITPSTKESVGHDRPMSREEIIRSGIVGKEEYGKLEGYAFAVFERGQSVCKKSDLVLVDAKYEFGRLGDEILLADELHTPDSSRYWVRSTYEAGGEPEMLDKEYFRGWLMEKGYMGEGKPPEILDAVRVEFAKRYVRVCGMLVEGFKPAEEPPTQERIIRNLRKAGYLQS